MPSYPIYVRDETGSVDVPTWRSIGVSGGITQEDSEGGDGGLSDNGLPTGGTVGQYLRKINSTNYASEWATPPGSGVLGVQHIPLTVTFDAGTIVSDLEWPDYSMPSLGSSSRPFLLSLASPYTAALWKKFHVLLTNVQTTPSVTTTFQLYSLTGAGVVMTVSLSGAPTAASDTLVASTTSASIASSADGHLLQIRCTSCPDGNAFGAFLVATYELT